MILRVLVGKSKYSSTQSWRPSAGPAASRSRIHELDGPFLDIQAVRSSVACDLAFLASQAGCVGVLLAALPFWPPRLAVHSFSSAATHLSPYRLRLGGHLRWNKEC